MDRAPSRTVAAFYARQAEARRLDREALAAWVSAVRTGHWPPNLLGTLDGRGLLTRAMQACARIEGGAPDHFRREFLIAWVNTGDHLRGEVSDDLVLMDGLRALLPVYTGGPLVLYRGESAWNRRRRTYGLSWSDDREVAESFAEFSAGMYGDGAVLLRTVAPPEAIICAPALVTEWRDEREFLVDRRKLGTVEVLRRYPEAPLLKAETHGSPPNAR
jgi:hypothetical protein